MKDHFSAAILCQAGYLLFKAIHVPKQIYSSVVDGLVETSLRGVDSHGVRLLPHYIKAALVGRINKDPKFSFKKTSLATGIFDADHGFGIAAGIAAMDKAIVLAKKSGMGAVVVKHSSHFGAAATFGLRAARANMIGLATTDVDALVFPYGGKKTYFGTNPICFTAPIAGEDPFCLDMATSRISLNKILAFRSENKQLDDGWAYDSRGEPTTDPFKAVAPAPMGDYKGYGLAAMVSILSSLLSGMPFGPHIPAMFPLDKRKRSLGHFFMAINISKFQPIAVFKRRMKEMADELRKVPSRNSGRTVLVPGDPEKQQYQMRLKKGIHVSPETIGELQGLAKTLGVGIVSWP